MTYLIPLHFDHIFKDLKSIYQAFGRLELFPFLAKSFISLKIDDYSIATAGGKSQI